MRPLKIDQPVEAATVIIVGALKEIGEITTEQQNNVIQIFQLHLSQSSAKEAFNSSIFMIKDVINFHQSIKNILAPNIDSFTPDQAQSLIKIVEEVIKLDGEPTETQLLIVKSLNFEFKSLNSKSNNW